MDYHNDGHSHVDALSHVSYQGTLYNGVAADSVTDQGASLEGIDAVKRTGGSQRMEHRRAGLQVAVRS